MQRMILSAVLLLPLCSSLSAQTAPKGFGGANLGSAQLMAVVEIDGTVNEAQSKGTVACQQSIGKCRISIGEYEVRFARDVTDCSYTVTLGEAGAGSTVPGMAAATSRSGGVSNGVFVATYATNGTSSDRAFHLQVIC